MNQCSHPSNRMPALYADLDRWFGDFFGSTATNSSDNVTYRPRWDISEDDTTYAIHVELPGLNRDEIHIDVKDDSLIVHGEKSIVRDNDSTKFHRAERRHGAFERQVRFPVAVDFEKVEAQFENGVLAISVPKSEKVLPKRIEISVSN